MNHLQLLAQCDAAFVGNIRRSPAEMFAAMAAWCSKHAIAHDVYGEGELIQAFEAKIAHLLGFPAGVFCITGTMAQAVALHLACRHKQADLVGLHHSAHILVHEKGNHQMLNLYRTTTLGEAFRPWLAADLDATPEKLGAVLYELPMREIGGQLPTWEQLADIKTRCHERQIHLHLDGARLWEAATAYERSLQQVCAGFQSAYVSFYKGIGGLGGSMLLGDAGFIQEAKVWIKRMGGNLVQQTPYVVAAAMQLDERLAAMPAWFAATKTLYQMLAQFPSLKVNPAVPHCNMLHLYLPVSASRCNEIRDQIALDERVWLFSGASNTALPQQCKVEMTIGERFLAMPEEKAMRILQQLVAAF
jgi:threonine aldolase